MCDFEGTTRRPLTIPPNFVPYMEKHRLYEFFYVIKLYHLVHFICLNIFVNINYITIYYNIYIVYIIYVVLYYILFILSLCYITFIIYSLYYIIKKSIGISDAITDPETRGSNSVYETMHSTCHTKTRYSQNHPYSSSKFR